MSGVREFLCALSIFSSIKIPTPCLKEAFQLRDLLVQVAY